ncbi:MAG TPA: pseudouridine synthase [Burkholderiales bacterium]
MLILFNKPFGVICQFSRDGERPTLADFVRVPRVYPAGRLDTDSEGLLLLTDDGPLQARISHPRAKLPKSYWVQVEGIPDAAALAALAAGVDLGDFVTRPGEARVIAEPPGLWTRDPPIRYRAAIPTAWIELTISEGKNRQVRRMTAKVGYPTLRLIRHRVGPYTLKGMAPGQWQEGDAGAMPRPASPPAAPSSRGKPPQRRPSSSPPGSNTRGLTQKSRNRG